MGVSPAEFAARTVEHYRDKFARHGATALGVDWNGSESQVLQFEQLLRLVQAPQAYSLNDFGCGYGALADFLQARNDDVAYVGYDLNTGMIEAARRRLADAPRFSFHVAMEPTEPADYGVARGVFTLIRTD